ncbi:MAG: tetratricopeptide repeat protein [Cytophagaceae bacterium]|nr:tetratricopeptide repeat protein [Cytophagaceae bacterium]
MRCPFVLPQPGSRKFRVSGLTLPAWPRRRGVLILLGLFLSTPSPGVPPIVARPDSLLGLSPARRYVVLKNAYYGQLLREDTSAALRVRREVEAFFQIKGSERDRFHLQVVLLEADLFGKFHLKRILSRAKALLQQAEAERDTMMIAKGHQNLGLFYFTIQKSYYLGFWHYGRTFELIRHRSEADYPEHTYTVYTLGRVNYDFFNYEKAIELGRTLHPSKASPVTIDHLYNAALIGLSYYHLQRYDSARHYFEWGLGYLTRRELANDAWTGIFNGNIGRVLAEQGQPEAAIPYLKKGLDYTTRFRVWDNVAPFGACLARIYLPTQPERAGHYAHLAHRAALREGVPKVLYETHPTQAAYYGRVGRADLALAHADSAATAKDRWQKELDVTLKHRAEIALEAERHQTRERLLNQEKDRQVLIRNGLLIFLGLAAALAYLLYARKALADRHRQAQARAKHERDEAELRLARAQLDQYLQHLSEKNSLIERISDELAEATEPGVQHRNDRIAALLDSIILTDADWGRFRQVFEQVHPGFFDELRHTHPDLTPAEVRLVALSKLGIPTREMALMLGVSAESVRKGRYRLRRKLEPLGKPLGADDALLDLLRPV